MQPPEYVRTTTALVGVTLLLVGQAIGFGVAMLELGKWQGKIETSIKQLHEFGPGAGARYTLQMAKEDRAEDRAVIEKGFRAIEQDIDEIKRILSNLAVEMRTELKATNKRIDDLPPDWFREDVEELKKRINKLESNERSLRQ